MQAALDAEWPYAAELFDTDHIDPSLLDAGVATDPNEFREAWQSRVGTVIDEATLSPPEIAPAVTGGRKGIHTEQMGYLLAEMQHLARSHPGATW